MEVETEKEKDKAFLTGIRVGGTCTHDHIVDLVIFIFVREEGVEERSSTERREAFFDEL